MLWSRNVLLYAPARCLGGLGDGLSSTVESVLLLLLSHSNAFVGYAEGAAGLCALLSSLPAAWLGDRSSRAAVMRCGAALLACAACAAGLCVLLMSDPTAVNPTTLYWTLFALLAAKGFASGICDANAATLYTDSVPTGSRSTMLTIPTFGDRIGRLLGPIVAIVLFSTIGDAWTVQDIKFPYAAGMFTYAAATLLLLLMTNTAALGKASDDILQQEKTRGEVRKFLFLSSDKHIPWLISFSDVMFGIASGITIKFIPIFLDREVKMVPLHLAITSACTFALMAAFMVFGVWVSKRVGRAQFVVVTGALGLTCLALIIGLNDYWQVQPLIASILVLRTALMNSRQAILRSILHDYVPKTNRGRWTAVDKISGFGWSGSALFGGLLLDHDISFVYVFMTTLILQFVASLFLVPLWVLVPRVEAAVTEVVGDGTQEETKGLLSSDTDTANEGALIAASDTEPETKR